MKLRRRRDSLDDFYFLQSLYNKDQLNFHQIPISHLECAYQENCNTKPLETNIGHSQNMCHISDNILFLIIHRFHVFHHR